MRYIVRFLFLIVLIAVMVIAFFWADRAAWRKKTKAFCDEIRYNDGNRISKEDINYYKSYLEKSPNGPYASESKFYLNEALWFTAVNNMKYTSPYATKHEKLPHLPDLDFLNDRIKEFEDYLNHDPEGRHVSQCNEIIMKLKWLQTIVDGSTDAFRKYVVNYPDSHFTIHHANKVILWRTQNHIIYNKFSNIKRIKYNILPEGQYDVAGVPVRSVFRRAGIEVYPIKKYNDHWPYSELVCPKCDATLTLTYTEKYTEGTYLGGKEGNKIRRKLTYFKVQADLQFGAHPISRTADESDPGLPPFTTSSFGFLPSNIKEDKVVELAVFKILRDIRGPQAEDRTPFEQLLQITDKGTKDWMAMGPY